jgi:hypothetical protein
MKVLKRLALVEFEKWYALKDRQPLVLRGARQVGKSTLVRDFCANHKYPFIEINLEKTKLHSTKKESFKISDLISEIEVLSGQNLEPSTIIFFDEIQEDPKLLKYLRYFYEETPQIPVIAAGSLLEIVLAKEEISFPVGRVQFLNIGPMTFFEFLIALGEEKLVERILRLEFSDALHNKANDYFRLFAFVGGMPKAVSRFTDSRSLLDVRDVQNQILETYKADFPKYGKRTNVERLVGVFESAASHLGTKVMYQELDSHAKARETRKALELLKNARILKPCIHCEASGLPLWASEDIDIYKLYFLDIGLVSAIQGADVQSIYTEIDKAFLTKGYLAEQFVAQHLSQFYGSTVTPHLNYWLRDKGSAKGEVDFLVQHKNTIVPIEVKSTASGHLKSLLYFTREKKIKRAVKISLAPFQIKRVTHQFAEGRYEIELIELPLYATEALAKVLEGS